MNSEHGAQNNNESEQDSQPVATAATLGKSDGWMDVVDLSKGRREKRSLYNQRYYARTRKKTRVEVLEAQVVAMGERVRQMEAQIGAVLERLERSHGEVWT
jgi:hypothetical protein